MGYVGVLWEGKRGGDGAFVVGVVVGGGWIDVFKVVRLSCGRLGGCGRGKGGGKGWGWRIRRFVFGGGFCGGREGGGWVGRLGCGSERGGTEGMSLKDQGVAGVENRVRVAER